jgi:hypothetical protein
LLRTFSTPASGTVGVIAGAAMLGVALAEPDPATGMRAKAAAEARRIPERRKLNILSSFRFHYQSYEEDAW